MPRNGLQIGAADGGWHVNAPVGEQGTNGLAKEVGIFEKTKDSQIEDQCCNHYTLTTWRAFFKNGTVVFQKARIYYDPTPDWAIPMLTNEEVL